METELARGQYASWSEKYVLAYGDEIIKSIPAGSIYFGGTDPGRGASSPPWKYSQIDGRPFFTLTQNALVDEAPTSIICGAIFTGRKSTFVRSRIWGTSFQNTGRTSSAVICTTMIRPMAAELVGS